MAALTADDTLSRLEPTGGNPIKVVIDNESLPVSVEVPAPEGGATEAKQDDQITQETAISAVLGATDGAAVTTDADGTLQRYARGLVTILGAVTASPVANTIGDRLKALLTGIVLAAGSNIIGSVKDAGPHWTSAHGIAGAPFTSADAQTAAAVTSAPTAGQKLVITDLFVSNNSAVALQFTFIEETSSTVIAGPFALPAGTSAQLTPRSRGWKLPVADKKLLVDVSAAGNVMIDAHYFSEA